MLQVKVCGNVSGMVAQVSETQVQDRFKFQRQEGGACETKAERMSSDFLIKNSERMQMVEALSVWWYRSCF